MDNTKIDLQERESVEQIATNGCLCEPSGYTKARKFLDQKSDCQLLNRNSGASS
jgi:hypothetical protein